MLKSGRKQRESKDRWDYLCMKGIDFFSTWVWLFLCIHLDWHRAYVCVCVCVLATMRCRTRSTNERHAYEVKERERITAPFVVHHVERISFLSVFFSRFLFSFLMHFLSLPFRHIIKQPCPSYVNLSREKCLHTLTYSLKRSVMRRSTYIQKKMT